MPPTTGLASAAASLRYWERRSEIVAHNLANASTDGFKAERVFARLLGSNGAALPAAQTATDLTSGALKPTGNPLDVAIQGDGFLVVQTPAGERFTRGGSLQLDAERRLVDGAGNPLLGERGPVVVPPGATLAVANDGAVSMDGKPVDRLRVERAGAGAELQHEGGTLLVPDAGRAAVPPADRRVRQGAVEESNVNPVSAMVDMIAVQRAYASVQKAVTTLDEVRGTAASDLGRPV
ncbi:flagellar hook-basal body protein [Roseisolibacter sp. H3M3-2]|uniref:flagellar hook-basal body protein n=1 Tax=Roseisolibacter sp. H3M3-2 TaxID=3031323 RepID=UPI0023DAFB80|nr:flagellar hook-basal body protein [Roseisolibacter sp. H3M3-2]MDF1506063.1 flagellar hook-basal body protein [Roseisolibacter sp. H3M3-2]